MKLFQVLGVFAILIGIFAFQVEESAESQLYDIKVTSLMGEPVDLHQFKGKKILFVNVASECGYTPQYEGLQKLAVKYKNSLVVIGVPCNQFGGQEPGSAKEIQTFCRKNYGVEFLITEKIDVKGDHQSELYQWLTSKEKNGVESSSVKWNFQKYLVDENGNYVAMFPSSVKPLDEKLTAYLN